MSSATRIWLYISVGLLLGLMLVDGGLAFWQIRQLHEHAHWVAHTHEVLEALDSAVSTVTNVETDQRGYVITADPKYLASYQATLSKSQTSIEQLAKLTGDNPSQHGRIARLNELTSQRLELLTKNIASVQQGDREAAAQVIISGEPKRVMDQIHALVDDMKQDELRLLAQRKEEYATIYRAALLNVGVASLAAIAALVAFLWLLRKHGRGLALWATAIHQQRELLRATLVSIGDGVISTDAGANVTFMNPVAETLTGWTHDEAEG